MCGAGEVRRSRCACEASHACCVAADAVWAVVGVVRVSESIARVCLRVV